MRKVLVSDILLDIFCDGVAGNIAEARDAYRCYKHVVSWIKNPDPGSEFERKTRSVRWLPGFVLLPLMLREKYDGIIFLKNNAAAGHIFFQKRKDAVHMFSIFVAREYRGSGAAKSIMQDFLSHIWNNTTYRRVRLGGGGHAAVQTLWRHSNQYDLPCHVMADGGTEEEGWVKLAA